MVYAIHTYSKYEYRYRYGGAIFPTSILVILYLEKYKNRGWGGIM